MAETIKELFSEEAIDARIRELGAQISRDYAGKELHLICVLKGSSFFTCELAKRITVPVYLDFMSVSSYGSETTSSGVVKIVKDLDSPLKGKDVIVVEDIVDTGHTLSYLMGMLQACGCVPFWISPSAGWQRFLWIISVLPFLINSLSDMVWTMIRNTEIFPISGR